MNEYECKNECCFHYNKIRFAYNCRVCDRKGTAAFLDECGANVKFKEKLEQEKYQ